MYQSHSPPNAIDAAKPTRSADSKSATEQSIDAASNAEGTWVVDTITLAEYEAQLKARAESAPDQSDGSKAEAVADAYFDKYSAEEIDASIVLDSGKGPDAVGEFAIDQNSAAVPAPDSPFDPDSISHLGHEARLIAKAEPVYSPTDDSLDDGVAYEEAQTDPVKEIGAENTEKGASVKDMVSGSANASADEPVAKVIEASNSHRTSASNNDLSDPVLLIFSLGLPLALILLMWNFGKILSRFSERWANRPLQRTAIAQENPQWGAKNDDGDTSLEREGNLPAQGEASDGKVKKDGTFKKVTFPRREKQLSAEVANSNALLKSELINARESLALVKANSQRRDSELQAKVKILNEQLSDQKDNVQKLKADLLKAEASLVSHQSSAQQLQAQANGAESQLKIKADAVAKLESDLRISKGAIATVQAEGDKRNSELLKEVGRLKEELNSKTEDYTKLESDFLTSEEALAAAQAKAAEREKELLVDLELLGEELGAKTANSYKLEADLARAQKSLDSRNDADKEHELSHQATVEAFEERLSAQSDAIAKLKSELLKSEESLAAAQRKAEGRANELQAKLELVEEELRSRTSTIAGHKAELHKAKQSLEQAVAREQQRNAEIQLKSEELEKKLNSRNAAFSKLKSKWLDSKKALAKAQAEVAKGENQRAGDIDRLEEELANERAASSKLEAEILVMKEALEDRTTNDARRVTELEADLALAEEKAEDLRSELSAEKAAAAESMEQLATSKSKVSKLKKRLSNAAVNRKNYMKLAKKVVCYKRLYRANEERINELVEENKRMSVLASEYLEAADGMIEELSGQAKLVANLKLRMLQSEQSAPESSPFPNEAVQDSKRNDLAELHPPEDALTLEADLEIDSDSSTLVASDGQPDDLEPDYHRPNRPR